MQAQTIDAAASFISKAANMLMRDGEVNVIGWGPRDWTLTDVSNGGRYSIRLTDTHRVTGVTGTRFVSSVREALACIPALLDFAAEGK